MKRSLLFLTALSGTLLAQGPLTPPGAPGETMRSLDQVEPRVPLVSGSPGVNVNAGTGTISISQGGSYFLTKNLVSTAEGINVTASNVTIDLRGFTIQASSAGINISGSPATPRNRIRIHNGIVAGSSTGISVTSAQQCCLEDLRIQAGSGASLSGIRVVTGGMACRGLEIRRCSIRGGNGTGISISADAGEISDAVIESCTLSELLGNAVYHGIAINGGTGNIRNCTIRHCSVSRADGYGIAILGVNGVASGNLISDCRVWSTGAAGIILSCTDSGSLRNNRIERCQADSCTNTCISVSPNNGACAGNVISDNIATGSTFGGFFVGGSNNLVIRNFASGNPSNYSLNAANTNGPLVTTTGTLTAAGTDVSPWANFSH